ncbi:5-dehydro-2-deoxygluconokinase [Dyadobacter luteus]|jgi:5-dehydro-2-deoxygluconokinase|uniref:5-dehydro-2-deoxygluconokinase n=1 Tax=Dyadobacter luteus TaxID=2259619 RepID=A0A3D8YGD1_9BACT|nr:5-dehydro-2-deoxygluconokinase [Dyadobacter luteus]REA63737.1 5-dehydro-2-deoxygluconokinase [Dyadobacter luteus]
MSNKKFDLLTLGRSSIDLYSANVGSPFEQISSFNAFVGGCPLNIATGAKRLGLNTAILTGIGPDQVGNFIKHFLDKEGVITEYVPTIDGTRSSAVVLGIEPPDRFPLVYYRENCADINLNIDHVDAIPFADFKAAAFSGTAFSKDPSRTAMFYALELAKKNNVQTLLDIDFRADQWDDPRSFGITLRAALSKFNIVVGTEEEILATYLTDKEQLLIKHQQISAPEIRGNIDSAIQEIMSSGVETLVVKRGKEGASIFQPDKEEIRVPGFPVEVLNVLGAGDAFCAGFSYGLLNNWDLYKSVRMGNACGAIIVTREGCANFMPTNEEVMAFVENRGGF